MTLAQSFLLFVGFLVYGILPFYFWFVSEGIIKINIEEDYDWTKEHKKIPNEYQCHHYYWPEVVARRKKKNEQFEEVKVVKKQSVVIEPWQEVLYVNKNGIKIGIVKKNKNHEKKDNRQ